MRGFGMRLASELAARMPASVLAKRGPDGSDVTLASEVTERSVGSRPQRIWGVTSTLDNDQHFYLTVQYPKEKEKESAPNGPSFAAWAGGAQLSALRAFKPLWITREEYSESGSAIVHRKCLF